MASNSDYEILLNKYNIAIAKAQDLQEQLQTKQKQWEKRDADFSVVEKVTRELCEDILAKAPKEMVLGRDYSWSSVPIVELVNKSKGVLKTYVENQISFMRKIMDQSEWRRQEIESLQEQISIMKTQPGTLNISQEDLKKQIEAEKVKEKAVATMPKKTKELVKNGKAEIVIDGYDQIDPDEEDLYDGVAEANAKVQITPKSVPVTQSRKQAEQKKKRKEEKSKAHMIDLAEYEKKLDEVGWNLIRLMGNTGISVYKDIESEMFKKDPSVTSNKLRSCMGVLTSIGITHREEVSNPLRGKMYVYHLTDMGARLYKDKFNKIPVTSEMDILTAEHDNCIHGYGIKFIADMMRESNAYQSVSDRNRKNPITISDGVSYVPDIICTDKNGHKIYFEYELVNHTQTNFNGKCNKMTSVTDTLNFIVPNREAVDKLGEKVKKWIENRGNVSLKHITVRVTSAYQIKDVDLSLDKNWKLVFKPGKRDEPYVNF